MLLQHFGSLKTSEYHRLYPIWLLEIEINQISAHSYFNYMSFPLERRNWKVQKYKIVFTWRVEPKSPSHPGEVRCHSQYIVSLCTELKERVPIGKGSLKNIETSLYLLLQRSWKRGILVNHLVCLSVRPSVCPPVDRIVTALYLQQYLPDPFHICTSYQAKVLANSLNLQLWLCLVLKLDTIWTNSMSNHGEAGYPHNTGVLVVVALSWFNALRTTFYLKQKMTQRRSQVHTLTVMNDIAAVNDILFVTYLPGGHQGRNQFVWSDATGLLIRG